MGGIVVLLMDREREDGIVVPKNVGGSVAVVDVGIDDDGLFDEAVGLQAADGDSNIVQCTEAFAVTGVSVVEAAAEIAGEAIAKGELSSEDSATGREPNGFGEFRRIRDLEFHDFAGSERARF